jgi:hypothetical protein
LGRPSAYHQGDVASNVLDALRAGKPRCEAAKAAGITPQTLRNIRRAQPAFAKLMDEAENAYRRRRAHELGVKLGLCAPDSGAAGATLAVA